MVLRIMSRESRRAESPSFNTESRSFNTESLSLNKESRGMVSLLAGGGMTRNPGLLVSAARPVEGSSDPEPGSSNGS